MELVGQNVLESLNTVHALWFLFRIHEAAERSAELLTAGPVGHAAEAGAVPVYFTGFFVEGALLRGFGFVV